MKKLRNIGVLTALVSLICFGAASNAMAWGFFSDWFSRITEPEVEVVVPENLVWEGDLVIASDSDVLAMENYTEVTGNLEITGDVTSLDGLASLTSVGGDLSIHNTTSLTSTVGLDNIVSIGGNVLIYENVSLETVDGLNAVVEVGSELDHSGHI
jgi:hypothetical protein